MGKPAFFILAIAGLRLLGHFTDPHLTRAQIHQVVGETARLAPAQPADSMRVITWNIQRGMHLAEVTAHLKAMNADVVMLQEADIACRRSGHRNTPQEIAHALNMNWVAAGEFQEIGEGSKGIPALSNQAILSRYSIEAASAIRFNSQAMLRWTLSPFQPRRGGRIALKARTAGLQLYNLHIESGGGEQLRARQMQQVLDDYSQNGDNGPAIIAGDFNNIPASQSPTFRALGERGFRSALEGTPPARTSGHEHPIDWIFLRGAAGHGRVVDTGKASDHFAVLADITKAAPQPGAHARILRTETTQTP